MGARPLGVSRSVPQVHALLYLADEPLPAEEIAEPLGLARPNVSAAARELQSFAPVSVEHRPDDRRDFFRAKRDPLDMAPAIIEERKRREIDPAFEMVRACEAGAAADSGATPPGALSRLSTMREPIGRFDALHGRSRRAPRPPCWCGTTAPEAWCGGAGSTSAAAGRCSASGPPSGSAPTARCWSAWRAASAWCWRRARRTPRWCSRAGAASSPSAAPGACRCPGR